MNLSGELGLEEEELSGSRVVDAAVTRIPAPSGDADAPLQALMFDSYYDAYRGVVSSVRVFNGVLQSGAKLRYVNAGRDHAADLSLRGFRTTPIYGAFGAAAAGAALAGFARQQAVSLPAKDLRPPGALAERNMSPTLT